MNDDNLKNFERKTELLKEQVDALDETIALKQKSINKEAEGKIGTLPIFKVILLELPFG